MFHKYFKLRFSILLLGEKLVLLKKSKFALEKVALDFLRGGFYVKIDYERGIILFDYKNDTWLIVL